MPYFFKFRGSFSDNALLCVYFVNVYRFWSGANLPADDLSQWPISASVKELLEHVDDI